MNWRKMLRRAGTGVAAFCAASLWAFGLYTMWREGTNMVVPLLGTGVFVGFFAAMAGDLL